MDQTAHAAVAPEIVDVSEAGEQLAYDEDRNRVRHRSRRDELGEIDAIDKLHHEEELAGPIADEIDRRDHVRMRELGGEERFLD
jgi:hypothetical protein